MPRPNIDHALQLYHHPQAAPESQTTADAPKKYFIGPMGITYCKSGEPYLPFLKTPATNGSQPPVLRLRPDKRKGKEEAGTAPIDEVDASLATLRAEDAQMVQFLRLARHFKSPDGPWIRHPDEISQGLQADSEAMRDDMTIEENRERHRKAVKDLMRCGPGDCIPLWTMMIAPAVDMSTVAEGQDEELVEIKVERWFVNAHVYLTPGWPCPPSLRDRFHIDWSWNARGVYYRHHYSPEWVTGDHSLWVPTLDGIDWDDVTEAPRRSRAKAFLQHTLDNARWNKSEYAWEADAWSDVFGQMRDDPVISADKHEYNAVRSEVHRVSCVQTGKTKFVRRIPDATFGLATYEPKHYQNALASFELDRERLEALALHRHCALLSDPRWGETNLVFPFAVYEAKGWSGDAREARYQACAAAAAYLDLLDALARHPGRSGQVEGGYQTPESRSTQVFALTSFGAHWHLMVGYRRPRLAREYAGRAGLSDTVYLFQRVWSGRVTTERKAWQLLAAVDQIHEWGVTSHRDFVIRHLRPWHEFGRRCYFYDAGVMHERVGHCYDSMAAFHANPVLRVDLPAWTRLLDSDDSRRKLELAAAKHMREAYRLYYRTNPRHRQARDRFPKHMFACLLDGCGPEPGYPMSSPEEMRCHYKECHGMRVDKEWRRLMDLLYNYSQADEAQAESEDQVEKTAETTEESPSLSSASGQVLKRSPRKRRRVEELLDGDPGPSSGKKVRPR